MPIELYLNDDTSHKFKKMSDIPAGVIIAPTDRLNKFYDTIYPPAFIHHDYKPEIMQKLLKKNNPKVQIQDQEKQVVELKQLKLRH